VSDERGPEPRFLHRRNQQEIPESVCLRCFYTLVAPSAEALRAAEARHQCSSQVKFHSTEDAGGRDDSRPK
jgi:hypothetical protein